MLEAIGRLVGGVAHDFNNLITGIVLCSELLLAGMDKRDRLRRYAEEIRSACAQGATLIHQLLAVARPRATAPQFLSLNEIITGMRVLLTRLIGENIELRIELANDLELVKMDPAQAQQIILNLVLNARDAMPDGGRVTLCTRNCDLASPGKNCKKFRLVEITVQDNGCGMDAETRARLFEPFFTTKGPGRGHGLGLATVHSIVTHSDGQVEVASAPGKGSQITIRLPGVKLATRQLRRLHTASIPRFKHRIVRKR